ncbi:MAG: ABC transporter ATP-binding protein [Bacteriovoracia bacterium]
MKIDNLQKTYGEAKILKGISLEIQKGQFISLLGASGSGKTTILRCIAGLEMPDATSGRMELNGRIFSGEGASFMPPEQRNLGMVFQNYAVWPHLDVFENVAFPLRIRVRQGKFAAGEVAPKVQWALELVKLKGFEKRFAHQLSGGQQQRVALARALAMSPDLLLLDEPLSNLDALLREELGSEIRRLQRNLNLTTILVTHDQKEALSLSDRIILLNQGRIEADGTPESLYGQPPTPFVATFLSGAQTLSTGKNEMRAFLPRRWKCASQAKGDFTIVSRIYLGNEYEYWAQNEGYSEPVRFFSIERMEMGSQVALTYQG